VKTIRPQKSLGQNFLHDPNIARKIVGSLRAPENAHVVEIGPGMGALTDVLLSRYPELTALEIDKRAVDYLRARLPGLDVRQADAREADWPALANEHGKPLYVIGNLPYHITSPILFSLLDAATSIHEAVLLMQLEVAERIVAHSGTKAYGILSVQTQLMSQPELLFRVSRHVFYPKPGVTSAVVRLTFRENFGRFSEDDRLLLRAIIRTAFNQRRKMLHNSPSTWSDKYQKELPDYWGKRRAEELQPEEFVTLMHYLQGPS